MSRGIYGQARVGEVTDEGVRRLGGSISFGALLVSMGIVGAAVVKGLTKLKLADRTL